MPDSSIMLELCAILDINVNQLLCGEKISTYNNQNNEELLLDMAKELNKIIITQYQNPVEAQAFLLQQTRGCLHNLLLRVQQCFSKNLNTEKT